MNVVPSNFNLNFLAVPLLEIVLTTLVFAIAAKFLYRMIFGRFNGLLNLFISLASVAGLFTGIKLFIH